MRYIPGHYLSVETGKICHGLLTNAPLTERERDRDFVAVSIIEINSQLCLSSSPGGLSLAGGRQRSGQKNQIKGRRQALKKNSRGEKISPKELQLTDWGTDVRLSAAASDTTFTLSILTLSSLSWNLSWRC